MNTLPLHPRGPGTIPSNSEELSSTSVENHPRSSDKLGPGAVGEGGNGVGSGARRGNPAMGRPWGTRGLRRALIPSEVAA